MLLRALASVVVVCGLAPPAFAAPDRTVPAGTPPSDRFANLVYQGDAMDEIFAYAYGDCSHGVNANTFDPDDAGEAEARAMFRDCMYAHGFSSVGAAQTK